jgi:hypothetical protein
MLKVNLVFLCMLAICESVAGQQYFPDHTFDERDKVEDFTVSWYSSQLKALKEDSLWQLSQESPKQQVYRFIWLRSFHRPVVVRLDVQPDGSGLLTTKVGSGAGGYGPGKLIVDRRKKMSKEVVDTLLAHVEEEQYWTLPTREKQDPNVVNLDGAQWVLEGVRNGAYKVVDRWSPKDGPIRDLGITMAIGLANMKLLYDEVY